MTARYIDWTHIRVNGSREAAAPYVGEGRKLLGEVMEEAARNSLGVHVLHRRLNDGTVIIAEKHGEIPRITITPAPPVEERIRRTTHGFHLTWASTDPARTAILFNEPSGEEGEDDFRDWSSSFFNSSAYGYALTPEDRRGPSYIDVFGIQAGEYGTRLLPANAIWVHPDDEEAVTWFRSYNGYWPHHYRHPITNYADYVSIYGHIVYTVPDLAWRVMAAAKRDSWLYVLIAEDLGALTPSMPPAAPSYSGQVWCSQPYADTAYHYSLWRYPLVVETDQQTGIEIYRAKPHDEAEQLWNGALELAYGAWSFNRDVTRCVTVQLPRVAAWSPVFEIVGTNWVPVSYEPSHYPVVDAHRIELELTHESSGDVSVELSSTLAPELAAEHDDVTLTLVETDRVAGYSKVEYRCGDFAVPAVERISGGGVQSFDRRVLVHAHLPSRTFLFYRWKTSIQPARRVDAGYELYVDGEAIELQDTAGIDSAFSAATGDVAVAGNFHRAMGTEFDDGITSWYRPMDAMTFLLGFTFSTQGAQPATGTSHAPGFGYQSCPFVSFSFTGTNYIEHSAAGGYLFGSVGGEASSLYWDNFPFAELYGANRGSYIDDEPMVSPAISHLGAAATFGNNTMAVVGLQPLLSVSIGGAGGGLYTLAHANRVVRFGTNGDAAAILDPLYAAGLWNGGVLGHTGKPRKHQRGTFHAS